ncbi:unnamed protein product [Clavelina lepadiformis]|uniref:Uncharacterized protein n=1 Tax=Clavelina lepadiformis TaxID=159417 RepID=A0ABP0G6I1_CLALP
MLTLLSGRSRQESAGVGRSRQESAGVGRSRQESNLRGQRPTDFNSVALTTRPQQLCLMFNGNK